MLKWLKRIGVLLAAIILLVVVAVLIAGFRYRQKAPERTLAGTPSHSSLYLPMSDGVRIAIDLTLPKDLKPGQKVPALIKGTPYWRRPRPTFVGGALAEFGLLRDDLEGDVPLLNARGYAVIVVDTRGTGASFGHVDIMFGDREVSDFGEIIDWAARQPWSNGRVGAYGFSYRGILAVDMASLNRPALKAIAPSFDFPDLYLLFYPGGVLAQGWLEAASPAFAALNRGDMPFGNLPITGPKPVDGDSEGVLRTRAIVDHARNWNLGDCVSKARNRDDVICASGMTLTLASEISRQRAIEQSGVPMHVTVGWFDANSAAQALQRFRTFSNPEELTVAALSHGGFLNTDPFADPQASGDPDYFTQISDMAGFFDRYLKDDSTPTGKTVRYFVLHGGGWKAAATWPPPDVTTTKWYFARNHVLSTSAPSDEDVDTHPVDFSASTGKDNRYLSPFSLSKTAYPDRAAQDKKLLTYTSAPLGEDHELAGNPLAKLTLATTASDGEVIVYLEDVAPDGTVTYLTEGVLRLAHRRAAAETGAAPSSDPLHTYLSADATPMTPGKAEAVEIGLLPIAVRLHKGERIRIAIAGADAGTLERIPANGNATLTVGRSAASPSWVALPERR